MELLTVEQAANLLKVSKGTIYGLFKSGKLEFVTVGQSKAYRIETSDLEQFISNNKRVYQMPETKKRTRNFKHLKP